MKYPILALVLSMIGTTESHAMGGMIPTATEQMQMQSALENTATESGPVCPKPITAVGTGKISCSIKTPGQVIGHALDEQLTQEAP